MDKDFDNGLMSLQVIQILDAESGWMLHHLNYLSNLEYMVAVDRMNVGVGKTPWAIEHRLVAGLNYTA